MNDPRRLAEAVRTACIQAALEAYEEGGIRGLCAEGRWEYAISAMQQLDVVELTAALEVPSQDDSMSLETNAKTQKGLF